MKTYLSVRTVTCGLAAALFLGVAVVDSVSAGEFNIGVRIGNSGPPPVIIERRWNRPYDGSIWIPGHYEWNGRGYVWYPGYYTYAPDSDAVWVPDDYVRRDGIYFYVPGRWGHSGHRDHGDYGGHRDHGYHRH